VTTSSHPSDDDARVAGADVAVRRARVADVRRIKELVDCYAGPILLEKSQVNLFEDVTEFWVGEVDGVVQCCGALHVLWEDLGEIRTVATNPECRGRGIGRAVCREIMAEARRLGVSRLFVLTFEVDFFAGLGFQPISELGLSAEGYAELRRSYDAGVAEFLDLPYVKPNTLGNTRMLKLL
jgi:amino-acid N-acetyltransferase